MDASLAPKDPKDTQAPKAPKEAGVLLATMGAYYACLVVYDVFFRRAFLTLADWMEGASFFVSVGALLGVFGTLQVLRERENRRPVDRFLSVLSIVSTSAMTFALMLMFGSGDLALVYFFAAWPWVLLSLAALALVRIATHRIKPLTRLAQTLAYVTMFFSTFWAGMAGTFWPEWIPWILAFVGAGVASLWFLFVIPTPSDDVDENEPRWTFNSFRTHFRAMFLSAFALTLFVLADQHLERLGNCEEANLECWQEVLGSDLQAPLDDVLSGV